MASKGKIVTQSVNPFGLLMMGDPLIEFEIDYAFHHPHSLIGANTVGALRPRPAARLEHDARAQSHEALIVAAIQGQFGNVGALDRAAHSGVSRLYQWNGFGDSDGLVLLAELNG